MAYYVWPCFASDGKVGREPGSDAKIGHLVIKYDGVIFSWLSKAATCVVLFSSKYVVAKEI